MAFASNEETLGDAGDVSLLLVYDASDVGGKGKIDDYWEAAKKELLGDPRLIDRTVLHNGWHLEQA
eukprot:2908400-Amphidinium_carterae.1